MTHGLPRWLRLLFTAVMLTLCAVMVTHLIHQHDTLAEIAALEGKIDSAQKRLAKQQLEYDEYTAALPEALAELDVVAPQAEAAANRAAELKSQRNALRDENAALDKQIADLEAQLAAVREQGNAYLELDEAYATLIEASAEPQP